MPAGGEPAHRASRGRGPRRAPRDGPLASALRTRATHDRAMRNASPRRAGWRSSPRLVLSLMSTALEIVASLGRLAQRDRAPPDETADRHHHPAGLDVDAAGDALVGRVARVDAKVRPHEEGEAEAEGDEPDVQARASRQGRALPPASFSPGRLPRSSETSGADRPKESSCPTAGWRRDHTRQAQPAVSAPRRLRTSATSPSG